MPIYRPCAVLRRPLLRKLYVLWFFLSCMVLCAVCVRWCFNCFIAHNWSLITLCNFRVLLPMQTDRCNTLMSGDFKAQNKHPTILVIFGLSCPFDEVHLRKLMLLVLLITRICPVVKKALEIYYA